MQGSGLDIDYEELSKRYFYTDICLYVRQRTVSPVPPCLGSKGDLPVGGKKVFGPAYEYGDRLLRERIDALELEKMRRSQQMAIVGVDFLEAGFGGGGKMDGVTSA